MASADNNDNEGGLGRRPKRSCARRTFGAGPSEAMYVGYVEDNETPEMIMKKFEALDKVKKALADASNNAAAANTNPYSETDHQGDNNNDDGAGTTTAAAAAAANAANNNINDDDGQLTDEQLRAVFKATSSARVARAVAGAADPWGYFDDDNFGAASSGGSGFFDDVDDEYEDEDAMAGFWSDAGGAGGGGGADYGAGDDDDEEMPRPRRGRGAGAGGSRKRPASRLGGGAGGAGGQTTAGSSRNAIPRTHHVLTTGGGAGGAQQALIRRKVRGGGGINAASVDSNELFTLRLPAPPMPLSWGRTVKQWEPPTTRARPSDCVLGRDESAVAEVASQVKPFAPDAPLAVSGRAVAPAHSGHLLASPDVPALAKKIVRAAIDGNNGYKKVFQAVVVHPGWVVDDDDDEGGDEATTTSAIHPSATDASLRRFASLDLHRLVPSGYAFVWCPKAAILKLTRQMCSWGFAYVENLTWVQMAPCNAIAADALPPGTPGRDEGGPSSCSARSYPPPLVARSHETLMIYRRGGEDVELRHQRSPDVVFDAHDAGFGGARAGGVAGCPVGFGMPSAVYSTIETMLPRARGAMLELWCGGRAGKRAGWTRVAQCCGGGEDERMETERQ